MNKLNAGAVLLFVGSLVGCQATNASFDNIAQLQDLASQSYIAGDLHQAEGYWLDIAKVMPEHNRAWCQLGHINYRLHRYSAASNAYQKCLAIAPQQLSIWHSLTAVKLREASETLLMGSAHLNNEENANLVSKYQLLMRELLRLHGIADGFLVGEEGNES